MNNFMRLDVNNISDSKFKFNADSLNEGRAYRIKIKDKELDGILSRVYDDNLVFITWADIANFVSISDCENGTVEIFEMAVKQ